MTGGPTSSAAALSTATIHGRPRERRTRNLERSSSGGGGLEGERVDGVGDVMDVDGVEGRDVGFAYWAEGEGGMWRHGGCWYVGWRAEI